MLTRRTFVAAAALLPLAGVARAKPPVVCALEGAAIGGYDPVAYFTEGVARRGSAEHRLKWRGAVWHFSSAQNREVFERMPRAYAPRYGGYCAYAMARGFAAKGDPDLWRIHNGRLYLVHDRRALNQWLSDISGHVERADGNWLAVLGRK
ncbi:YHS domain protein [Pseudooceanicola lipolyticus]|uniref:YHS domain protein n=2 Tax=Pseudooceanicola TaxID=1679449 RepID=A0A2M8J603_9RHOB|nr:YHS domain-containing (seleno)protein [Pseudooceanicola lipolyticus]PJE38202.1 YHS domain protein [Pseudooceanicola lipolyticus]